MAPLEASSVAGAPRMQRKVEVVHVAIMLCERALTRCGGAGHRNGGLQRSGC